MTTKLDNKAFRSILIILMIFLVLVFIFITFYGLSFLSKKSNNVVQLKARSQIADNQLTDLEHDKKEVEQYSYFKNVAKTVITSDKDQAETVFEINQMAKDSGIILQSVDFPTSALGSSHTSGTGGLTQAKPVPGIPGLYSLELTITPQTGQGVPADKQVTYSKMLDFFKRIENNRHTAQISQVSIQPANDNCCRGK